MVWIIYGFVVFAVFILVYPAMRIMSVKRVFAALITAIVMTGALFTTKAYLAPYVLAWQYERNIRLDHAFSGIAAAHFPKELQDYLNAVKARIIDLGAVAPGDELRHASLFINQVLVKFGPYASDDSLYEYLKLNADYDKILFQQDPGLVLFHDFPEKVTTVNLDLAKIDTTAYISQIFKNAEKVVLSGVNHSHVAPSKDEEQQAMIIFKGVIADLSKQYGAKVVVGVLENPGDSAVDPKEAATIVMAFYQKLIDLGAEKAAIFMRVTFMLNKAKS